MKNSIFCKTVKRILLSTAILGAAACSTFTPIDSKNDSIKERRLSTDFTDEGVKIFYTLTGKLEKIEVAGQAEAWKGNVEAVSEADALAKLVKFVYGNDVSTDRKVKIIGKAIEDSENTQHQGDTIATNSKELEESLNKKNNNASSNSIQTAKVLNQTVSETVTNITSRGKLVGVRKVRDYTQGNGKIYVAIFQWSEKDLAISESMKSKMNKDR